MRVAALADVHGNLPALEAVLADVEREHVDLIVFCGDVASGPMPAATIEALRRLKATRFVRGNADRGIVETFDGTPAAEMRGPLADWCASQVTREQRDFLASFDATIALDVDGLGRVLFCHASPRNDVDVFTVESSDERVRALIAGIAADVVVCGHTHMQFDRKVDGVRIVNPGSVGMPYGEAGAFWALLSGDVDLRRIDYDREAAGRRMRAAGHQAVEEFVTDNVLRVPSAAEALSFMREMEAKQAAASGDGSR
jgi:putative phosphoesterase